MDYGYIWTDVGRKLRLPRKAFIWAKAQNFKVGIGDDGLLHYLSDIKPLCGLTILEKMNPGECRYEIRRDYALKAENRARSRDFIAAHGRFTISVSRSTTWGEHEFVAFFIRGEVK
jgi:hypothetical protein